jgi:hypothetical protein
MKKKLLVEIKRRTFIKGEFWITLFVSIKVLARRNCIKMEK